MKQRFYRERPALLYQRDALNNYTGLLLSRELGIPFILEYNGSNIWVSRNWGSGLLFEKLAERVEIANLRAADLVVVVSKAIRDELVVRGIEAAKILVNPNGVDPNNFGPQVEGLGVGERYALTGKTVVGFIGTFGPWHGAEVLAQAAVEIFRTGEGAGAGIHFLFIGDGMCRAATQQIIEENGFEESVTFAGLVPQDEGPFYLAACDILVLPHVPNPDGTPFFGSPTKLFEYMAMGKGIVASHLDQIAEVLEHGRTAWMVKAGDCSDLAAGILHLSNNRGICERLGEEARKEVITKYTWDGHVQRIFSALEAHAG